ncbi:MAG: GNAT family N-acetyltransferase [Candidatus Dormibacteraeota bacterium]|nr:GNAT family N-acetyltransferase [Candidatus Dormibacteraeota bacterium]
MAPALRDARDGDAEQLIELIADVFAEYPGCVLDVDGEMPQLRSPASAFAEWQGRLWVAESGARIVGCAGLTAIHGVAELKHLYVAAQARRRGLGGRLCELVEAEARRRGHSRIELWTDTRFGDAHRLYESRGYVRGREVRELHDLSASVEYFYSKPL